jgi:RimJ/RimL family protein N-acetyltransferase
VKIWTEFFEDKEATEFFPPTKETSEQQASGWIDRLLLRYANKRYGLQALYKKDTHEFVGQCGLLLQEVDGIAELEVGYHILKKYWGNGYAPEAAQLFIDYAFKNNLAESVISIIDTRNVKSQRVADKNGLLREKETVWSGLEVYIYRVKKADWR